MKKDKIAFTIEEASEYTGIGRKVLVKTDILETFMTMNEGRNLRDRADVKAVTRNTKI